jgi:tetratricopeptide (TPR) repeat protein
VGERRALVIASQCASLNLLSFLPEAAKDVAEALLDPEVGGCVPALADGRRMLVDPTMVELDDAVTEAFERASEDEATLFIALVGHGDYADEDFYFLTKDTTDPVNSRNSFLLAQRIKELLGRYSLLDGLVILLDTCHAGIAAQQAATRWIRIVGEAGKRFEVLTASDDRTAADGCFSRSLAKVLRSGRPELGERVRCPDLKRVIGGLCPTQTAVHLSFDGVRTVEKGDEGLWLALNNSDVWRPLLGHPAAAEIERLNDGYHPTPELGKVVGHLLTGVRYVQVLGIPRAGASSLVAALARPAVAEQVIPPKFLQAVLFLNAGTSFEQLSDQLAWQLRRNVPGFAEAERETDEALDTSAFDRAVLRPLRALGGSGPIRIAFDDLDALPEPDRSRLLAATREMTDDPELGQVAVVISAGAWTTIPGATVVALPFASMRVRNHRPKPGEVLPPEADTSEAAEEKDEDENVVEDSREVLLNLLRLTADRGPLPIRILAAASRRTGGPERPAAVRDVLARLSSSGVERANPGTDAELVKLTGSSPAQPGSRRWQGLLAQAIREVAPVADNARRNPEQVYARASEAEHLWLAGLYEKALQSLDDRPSEVPVENRERWAQWLVRVSGKRGATDPLTLKCRARLATWTGKAGDQAAALAQFHELLPTAQEVLRATDRELLSIRNNIGYLLMELGRHEEAKAAFLALATDCAEALSETDRETIHARHLFAVATGKCGAGEEALRLSRELLPVAERELDASDEIVAKIGTNIVYWSAESAHPPPPEVFELYRRLRAQQRRTLNDRHPDVLSFRYFGALLYAESGQVAEALADWTAQLPDAVAVLGERHEDVHKIRAQLVAWGPPE